MKALGLGLFKKKGVDESSVLKAAGRDVKLCCRAQAGGALYRRGGGGGAQHRACADQYSACYLKTLFRESKTRSNVVGNEIWQLG